MPKRKSECLEDDLERILKKVRKLEKKIRARNDATASEAVPPEISNEEPVATAEQEPDIAFDQDPPIPADYLFPEESTQIPLQEPDEAVPAEHISDQNTETPNQGTSTEKGDAPSSTIIPNTQENPELDEDILEILGDDPSSAVKRGSDTRKEVASRFQHITIEGLSKESRKELMSKYLLPANCLHIGAPSINPEIKAALAENIIKRDKGIETKQKEMASAISGVTELISMHLASKEKNNVFLQKLMDVGRILCDIQHGDSVTRRNFILFSVKNDMQEHLKNTKIDTSLFGEQLSETLKSARAVNKSGADLKADNNKAVPPKKASKPPVNPTLNRKAAPPRRPLGAAQHAPRTREYGAPRAPLPPPPAPAYRTSLTQQQPPLRPHSHRRY